MRERAEIKRKTSGSRTRQRSPVSVMLTPAERAKAEADAVALGLTLSGYARSLLMGAETPGTPHRPTHDVETLARLSGQLGKVGSNLNQLTRLGNQGEIVAPPELAACLAEVRALALKLDEALR